EHEVPEASANAEFLIAAALNINRAEIRLRSDQSVTLVQQRRFWRWVVQKGQRIPLAYILGTQPFMDLELKVNPQVLIPRPETEELAEIAIGLAKRMISKQELAIASFPRKRESNPSALKILDIGTGSGCIALALAQALPQAEITATDVSKKAIAV